MMKKTFTLIELLIVISIIAILAGMLLPALGTAKDTVKTITCGSNVRQVAQAVLMYLNNNDDTFPSVGLGGKNPGFPVMMAKDGMLTSGIVTCTEPNPYPVAPVTVKPQDGATMIGLCKYLCKRVPGISHEHGLPDDCPVIKSSKIRKPSKQLLAGESSHYGNGLGQAPYWWSKWTSSGLDTSTFTAGSQMGSLVTRHKKQTQGNVAFMDGHVLKVTIPGTEIGRSSIFKTMEYFGTYNWAGVPGTSEPALGFYLDWVAPTSR